MFTEIMVPLDGSELAERVLPYAEYLAGTPGATLHLVFVVEPPAAVRTHGLGAPVNVYQEVIAAQRQEATDYLECTRAGVEGKGRAVSTRVLDGYAADALLDYARDAGIDLVVMATHGHAGVTRWALGSVADRVAHGGVAPVLLVPAEVG